MRDINVGCLHFKFISLSYGVFHSRYEGLRRFQPRGRGRTMCAEHEKFVHKNEEITCVSFFYYLRSRARRSS